MRDAMTVFGLLVALVPLQAGEPASPTPEQIEFFEKHIRPVLAEHCYACHGPQKQRGGLRLDTAAGMQRGSSTGPVVVPGQPERSLLLQAVRQEGEVKMPPPPRPKLSPQAIADLTTWVKMGAPWPAEKTAVVAAPSFEEAARKHWAFQPLRPPSLPQVRETAWVRNPIDLFVLAGLEKQGLRPAATADRRTLLRRLSFDLIGLPPTAEEVAAFEADTSPEAYEKVVERLLASPHFGERWGRYWLDVARYADTKGYVFEEERRYPYAYTYRDYVVRAFNEDLPFDRFVQEQLAADQLLAVGGITERRALAALGFLTLGRRFLNNIHDIIDDRIDVVTRGLLGLTVTCARCHDHKYDPITQKDYYALYGVFASCEEPRELPLLSEPTPTAEYQAFTQKLQALQAAVKDYQEKHKAELAAGNRQARSELRRLQKAVDQFQATAPGAPPRAMVLVDRPTPVTPHVFLRGNPTRPGPAVPRRFLAVLCKGQPQPFQHGSGRLELAQAITRRDNPLTARVFVNRVWLHLFGTGLVPTPSDFGLRSEPPTHPDLLDYLAWRFQEEGGSVKKLIRLIVLSQTYRQSSQADPLTVQRDPENRWLGRHERRRLDWEALRDALLAVSGRLDRRLGGPAVDLLRPPFSGRRTLYGFIDRQNLPGVFRTFDFASPDTTSPQRHETTVPQQALYLLNNPFVLEQARQLAQRPEVRAAAAPAERIQTLYRLVFARLPDAEELQQGLLFLSRAGQQTEGALGPWERYAHVLLLTNEFVFVD
jgi:mono/diheme cytochrome c family protein